MDSKTNSIIMRYDKLQTKTAMVQGRKCDKYDYLIAGFSGAVAGLIDSVFVGAPNESILGKWTDASTDAVIRKMAKMHGWKPQSTNTDDINHAIKYFEANYPVNYDQAYGKAVSNLLDMNSRNHHIKSLAHAPDVFGLVFSVLDQFANTLDSRKRDDEVSSRLTATS